MTQTIDAPSASPPPVLPSAELHPQPPAAGTAAGIPAATSTYLQYLPSLYQSDPFIGRFLLIVESILAPLEREVDTIPDTLDPRLAPPALLPWLASWVGVELDQTWPLDRQRELVARAASLYRWRGTRRGLEEHLRIYTGNPPLIVENAGGLRLGQAAAMGFNTSLGQPQPATIAITVVPARPDLADERAIRRIVEREIPAWATYTLDIVDVPPS